MAKRVYLNKVASTRRELVSVIGSENFKVKNARYSVRDVVAIRDSNDTYKGFTNRCVPLVYLQVQLELSQEELLVVY